MYVYLQLYNDTKLIFTYIQMSTESKVTSLQRFIKGERLTIRNYGNMLIR